MFEREDKVVLKEIKNSFDKIFEMTDGISYEDFKNNSVKIQRVLSLVGQIGNDCKYITGEFRLSNDNINWNYLSLARKRLSHNVFSTVNTDVVWTLIKEDFPSIHKNISELI